MKKVITFTVVFLYGDHYLVRNGWEDNLVRGSWTVNLELCRGQSCLWRRFTFLDEH
jgi:hypothetical protein